MIDKSPPKGQVTGSNPVGVTIKNNNIKYLYFYNGIENLN